jgi:hypothetical protein
MPDDEVTIKEPKIHFSVFERMRNGAHAYAPFVLPENYAVVDEDGRILDKTHRAKGDLYESPTIAAARAGSDPAGSPREYRYWPAFFCPRCMAFYMTFISLMVILVSTPPHISLDADRILALDGHAWVEGILSILSSPWTAFSDHPVQFGGALAVFVISLVASFLLAGRPQIFLPKPPAGGQEDIWNLVWHRRLAYFVTLGFSAYLVLFPFIHSTQTADTVRSSPLSFISPIIRLVGAVLPSFASFWTDAFAANPGWFLIGIAGVIGIMWRGASVASQITDAMRTMWCTVLFDKTAPAGANVDSRIYRLRTDECYRSMLWALKRNILPVVFGVLFIYLGCVAIIRPVFAVTDSVGYVCTPSADHDSFPTNALCWDTGQTLAANTRFTIVLTHDSDWKDGDLETDFGGYGVEEMTFWKYLTWPLRRSITQSWFKPIARIGDKGGDEYPLDSVVPVDKRDLKRKLVARITTRTSGRLYLYVNDAIGIPFGVFYRGNGSANVCVQKSPDIDEIITRVGAITGKRDRLDSEAGSAVSEKPNRKSCL